jgi:hypothetical protein
VEEDTTMRYVSIAVLLVFVCGCAFADDIVTMPTANQLKAGEVDVALYYISLDFPSGAPQYVQYQTLYVGLTDRFELDFHRAAVDNDETSVVLVGSAKLLSETPTTPDLVFGIRNIGGAATTKNPAVREKSKDRSLFLSAAKTFFFNPAAPGPPLVRAHLSLGTADWTLFGEERHKGLFGGLQFLFTPWLGAVVQDDGRDLITGITIMPPNTGLTFKGGTYGDHTWIGVAWRKDFF